MEVIRHAELIVERFLWMIEHTNSSLDNSKHCKPDEARDGRNVALNDQVTCWCARSSKGTILLCSNHLKTGSFSHVGLLQLLDCF